MFGFTISERHHDCRASPTCQLIETTWVRPVNGSSGDPPKWLKFFSEKQQAQACHYNHYKLISYTVGHSPKSSKIHSELRCVLPGAHQTSQHDQNRTDYLLLSQATLGTSYFAV